MKHYPLVGASLGATGGGLVVLDNFGKPSARKKFLQTIGLSVLLGGAVGYGAGRFHKKLLKLGAKQPESVPKLELNPRNVAVGVSGVVAGQLMDPFGAFGVPARKLHQAKILNRLTPHTDQKEVGRLMETASNLAKKLGVKNFKLIPNGSLAEGLTSVPHSTIHTPSAHPEIAFHELKHFKVHKRVPLLTSLRQKGVTFLPAMGIGLAAGADKDSALAKAAPAVAAAGTVPLFADEAIASISSIRKLKRLGASKELLRTARKNLAKGFGTYGLYAAPMVGLPVLIRGLKTKKDSHETRIH